MLNTPKGAFFNDIWTEDISFYLDGVGFIHKCNPCLHAQRNGTIGNRMKGAASIAYGKDVTMGEELVTKLNGDPSQNSTLAMDAVAEIGGTKFGIPPQSPDLNPIKNK